MNFFYLVKPMYGGWPTFTAHLLHRDFDNKAALFKMSPKLEHNTRPFAFDLRYQNVNPEALRVLDNQVIIAFDKNYETYLQYFTNPTLFIHAMNEPQKKYLEFYKSCKRIIVIRQSIADKMKEELDLDTEVAAIPFYQYPLLLEPVEKTKAISMARVEYRKRQDIICKANMINAKRGIKPIDIYGHENGIYTYQTLKELDYKKWFKGRYAQDFNIHQQLLNDTKFLVNLTQVKNDGGTLEYATLQAIYQDTAVILHRDWIDIEGSVWKENYNCFGIGNEDELAELIKIDPDISKVTRNAKKLLQPHITSKWV